jgi:hypothetical protein
MEDCSELQSDYHLFEVVGLPDNARFAENLNRLATFVAKNTQHPVSAYKRGNKHYLATTADSHRLTKRDWRLTPHVATLKATSEKQHLNYSRIGDEQIDLALNLLRFQIRGALSDHSELWSDSAATFYLREPLNQSDEVDVYIGFSFHLHYLPDKKFYLSLDSTVKYVDKQSLLEHLDGGAEFKDFRLRQFLYRSAHNWFRIRLMALASHSIAEQKFVHRKDGQTYFVYDWTLKACRGAVPDHIKRLSPDSPAILYRFPNDSVDKDGEKSGDTDNKDLYGAAGLCYKTYQNDAPEVRRLHKFSLATPYHRLAKANELIRKYFQRIPFRTFGMFSFADRALTSSPKRFYIPRLLYGKGKVLQVRDGQKGEGVDITEYARKRLEFLQCREGGLLTQDPLGNQYILAPQSLHRSIIRAGREEHVRQIRRMHSHPYRLDEVWYEDSDARNLHRQVSAIKRALERSRIDRGTALLVLPENAHKDLHNYLKRELFGTLQTQCLNAASLKRFFVFNGREFVIREETERDFYSYMRYVAIGTLLVSRVWPFALADPMNYDVHIGIDVLNGLAGFTYLYQGGKEVIFRHYTNTHGKKAQGEKLSPKLLRQALYDDLREDLQRLQIKPSSLVIHRDGRSYEEEIESIKGSVRRLKTEWRLPSEAQLGVVEINKSTTSHLRLFLERQGRIENPEIGDWFALNAKQGIVCNTGWPFRMHGTVRPLLTNIAYGDLEIGKVLEDEFCMAMLAWTAPDRPSRVPIINRLGDFFLRPLASDADEEAARYDDDGFVEFEEEDEAKMVSV